MNILIHYPKCTTCQKAKKWLDENDISYQEQDIKTNQPSLEQLRSLHQKSGLPLKRFFNTSGLVYRSLGLATKLQSMTEDEQYELLSTDGMLVKRPIFVSEDVVVVGFKESDWTCLK